MKSTPLAGKVMASVFWDSQGILFINFLIEQLSTQLIIQSFLKTEQNQPFIQDNKVNQSKVCLLHDNVCSHTTAVTTGILKEMHSEVLPPPHL
jgi:hypothetical protein